MAVGFLRLTSSLTKYWQPSYLGGRGVEHYRVEARGVIFCHAPSLPRQPVEMAVISWLFGQFSTMTKLDEMSSCLFAKGRQNDWLCQNLITFATRFFLSRNHLLLFTMILQMRREKMMFFRVKLF